MTFPTSGPPEDEARADPSVPPPTLRWGPDRDLDSEPDAEQPLYFDDPDPLSASNGAGGEYAFEPERPPRTANLGNNLLLLLTGIGCIVLGLLIAATRPLVVPLFSPDAEVQQLLAGVLLIVALHQPIAGVVFVLDGVLIGAGDGRYLAWAGVINLLAFAPLALAVVWSGGGLGALWWAFSGFMLVRMLTLLWRARGERWLVLGAAVPRARGGA